MADQKRKARSDGRVEVKITENGIRISKYFESSAEANAWRTLQKALQLNGIKAIQEKVLFGPLAESWLAAKKGGIRQTTWRDYRSIYDNHIADKFAQSTLKQVLDGRQDFINAKKEVRSPSLVHKLHIIINSVLLIALDRDLIRKIPRIVGLPAPVKRRPVPMTKQQLVCLVKAAGTSRYLPILWLELATGLRRGELLALEWDDLTEAGITVNKSLNRFGVLQPPKTESGNRTIALDPWIIGKVKAMPRCKIKGKGTISKILFCTSTGKYCSPRNFSHLFSRWVTAANKMLEKDFPGAPLLTAFRLHDMRHQFGSLLADLKVHPSVAKEMTGHSREDMVMDYTRPNALLAKEAATSIGDKLADLLG